MKQLVIIFFILVSAADINAQDMQTYLQETRTLFQQGKYKEALERHIWFHDHALEHDQGMQGVRLSFALSDWKKLADVYPPALEALKNIRDTKTAELLNSGGTKELFADVNGINRTLGENEKTITLFEAVTNKKPELGKTYWRYVKKDLFAAKRYDLISEFIGNPMAEYEAIVEHYNMMTEANKKAEKRMEMLKNFTDNDFVEKTIQLIQYALASKDMNTAKEIQRAALKVVPDARLRDAISG